MHRSIDSTEKTVEYTFEIAMKRKFTAKHFLRQRKLSLQKKSHSSSFVFMFIEYTFQCFWMHSSFPMN